MAFIDYIPETSIPEADRVDDQDNILQVHGIHSRIMRQHYDLYRELMYARGPLSRTQRELIGVTVSAINECHY
ncbi:MAG: carboxymuconolactone decarboxylase family protein [Acidobacteriota bacterium]|nr:carboxymuconolactone decarboxylase family protein [Acidobacteriota bacterium]MDH3785004.1 carboxymuconolactone decarboxylase family protein [Acidobacteriota bacterium]